MAEKILLQVTINKEKHPELWEKLYPLSPRSRAEILRSLALRGITGTFPIELLQLQEVKASSNKPSLEKTEKKKRVQEIF